MNREIEFRAKANDEWCYGSLLILDERSGHVYILEKFTQASTLPVGEIIKENLRLIDINTISQYTGLKDIYGKKIFEGDVVSIWENGKENFYKVVNEGGCWMITELNCELEIYPLSVKHKQSRVCCNIYDYPELCY